MINAVPSKEERCVIKFLILEHTLLAEIHYRLCCIYSTSVVVSLCAVERWHKKFAVRHTSIANAAWCGRSSETITEMVCRVYTALGRPPLYNRQFASTDGSTVSEVICCVHTLFEEDHCYTITNLQVQMAAQYAHDTSHSTIHKALCEYLQISKVCARWVPQQLTVVNRKLYIWQACFWWTFKRRETHYSNASLLEMNHLSISVWPRNRILHKIWLC